MPLVVNIAAAQIEYSSVAISSENFEAGAESDFERYLARAEETKREISRESDKVREELASQRKELADDLESRRERLDEELKRARARERASEEEAEKAEESKSQGFGADRVDKRTAMKAVFIAGTFLPFGYKGQLQTSLLATGNPDSALNGWLLGGGGTSAGLLKTTLERLGSLTGRFKLDSEGLEDLRGIFKDSGLDDERINKLIDELAGGDLTLDRVLLTVSKAEAMIAEDKQLAALEAELEASDGTSAASQGGLTATADGLTSLGQFLMSLGLTAETVKAVTSAAAPGESLSSVALSSILTASGGEELLAPCLVDGDLESLYAALKSMGLDARGLEGLNTLLSQSGSNLGDLLGLLAFLETPEPLSADPAKAAADVQKLLTSTSQVGSLVKEPIFNEMMIKLTSLGDREITEDFAELSPALQALRGGLGTTGSENQLTGQNGGGQSSRDGRERQERHLAAMGLGGETAASRAAGDGLFQSALAGQGAGASAGESIARQIEQKLLYSARNGVHRLKMNLSPESLGRLDVELKVKGDKLVAFINADTEEAYAALESEMGALKEALAAEGLELTLTLSYDGQESFSGRGGDKGVILEASDSDPSLAEGTDSDYESGGRLFDRVV